MAGSSHTTLTEVSHDMKMKCSKEEQKNTVKQVKTWNLKNPEKMSEYQQIVQEKHERGAISAVQTWQRIRSAMMEGAIETCGRSKEGQEREQRDLVVE